MKPYETNIFSTSKPHRRSCPTKLREALVAMVRLPIRFLCPSPSQSLFFAAPQIGLYHVAPLCGSCRRLGGRIVVPNWSPRSSIQARGRAVEEKDRQVEILFGQIGMGEETGTHHSKRIIDLGDQPGARGVTHSHSRRTSMHRAGFEAPSSASKKSHKSSSAFVPRSSPQEVDQFHWGATELPRKHDSGRVRHSLTSGTCEASIPSLLGWRPSQVGWRP